MTNENVRFFSPLFSYKKFSTLLAGVALFGATSAFAGNNVPSLIEGTNDGLYQLKTPGNLYLAVNAKGELVTVDNVTDNKASAPLFTKSKIGAFP